MRDFVSGGAAASSALLKFLADREEQERQGMLDRLAVDREGRLKDQHQQSMKLGEAQLGSLDESRKSAAALRDEQMEAARVKRAGEMYRPGDVVEDPSAVPAAMLEGQKTLPARTMDVQSAPGVIVEGQKLGAEPTGKQTFRGTSEQRAAAEEKARMDALMSDPSVPEAARAAVRAGAKPTADMFMTKPDTRSLDIQAADALAKGDKEAYARLLQVKEEMGKADDRPQMQPFPVVIQTAQGPQLLDRSKGQAQPITDAQGMTVGMMPTADMRNREASMGRAEPVFNAIDQLSAKININFGLYAKMAGGAAKLAAKGNLDDDVATYEALISGFIPLVARAVGHSGVLTEQDVQSVRMLFPKPGDSESLRKRKLDQVKAIMGAQPLYEVRGETPPNAARPNATASVEPPAPTPTPRRYNPATRKVE